MAFRIPGTNFKIGKDKKKNDKKKVLSAAYKKVLADPAASAEKKTIWPEMKEGVDLWYDKDQENLRRATAAGLMRAAEREIDAPLDYELTFDDPRQEMFGGGARAFSAGGERLVNVPSALEGYMSKPQYLSSVLSHEVAHNKDYEKNHPTQGHSIETFRPLEKAAYRASMLEPSYLPGDDIGPGGMNEYPDEYKSLGPWKDQYFLSGDQMNATRNVFPVNAKDLAREIINRRNIARSGPIRSGGQTNLGGGPRGNLI